MQTILNAEKHALFVDQNAILTLLPFAIVARIKIRPIAKSVAENHLQSAPVAFAQTARGTQA